MVALWPVCHIFEFSWRLDVTDLRCGSPVVDVEVLHRIGVRADVADVYDALATRDGVAGWWTSGATGDGSAGGRLRLPFAAPEPYVVEVVEAVPGEHVRWRVLEGPPEWVGTHVDFRLSRPGEQTVVLFRHEGWAEPVEFMHHCSTKWAAYLFSLRDLVETGSVDPHQGT